MTPSREIILSGEIEGQQVALRIAIEPFGVSSEMRKAVLDYFEKEILQSMKAITNVPVAVDPRQRDFFEET